MAEPIPPQPQPAAAEALAGKPLSLIVGETPIYLTTPVHVGEQDVPSLTILSADKRSNDGVGSAVPLVKEASRKKGEEGMMVDKPLTNLNAFDEVSWEKVSGLQWTDTAGEVHTIPKEELSLAPVPEKEAVTQPEPKVTEPEKPFIQPTKEARSVLETLTEDPNTITIVGLKAYETRALDLADRSMQRLVDKTKEERHWLKDLGTTIWKQSIGGIYFHEKSRQYYMEMLKAAETPFAEEAIRLAERRATDVYNKKLADSNFVVRAGTRAVDWFKDKVGMRTTIQKLALEEIGAMKAVGEIKGMETLDREAKAVRARFGQDMDKMQQFVREQLGEKLEILDPKIAEHKPLVEGIQGLLKQYASGEIPDKVEFDKRAKEFFNATLKNVRPDIFAEAELYSSSLFDAAKTLRTKMSHEAGLANLDEAIIGMQIRLGLGQMGEVTSLEPTAVEKGVGKIREVFEWLNKKHVIVPMVFNEATIGSGVAIALSATRFLQTTPARVLGGLGGGALAGGLFAGWREYGQLNRDYLTHLREKETGAQFTETQKRRSWFERFAVEQRSASEMITTLQSALYTDGALKATLTDDELRRTFATVADLQARKAVSETGLPAQAGPKKIGLIRYTNREAIESERAALDLTANKALTDLDTYLAAHAEQAGTVLGGNTFPDFMVKLTTGQTQVLREGVTVLANQEDPVYATLNLVNQYAPEAAIVKRRWPFASRILTGDEKAMGLDAIMEEFKKEARVEAVKYGIKAGAIGAAIGAAIHGLGELGQVEKVSETVRSTTTIPLTPLAQAHNTITLSTGDFELPREIAVLHHLDDTGHSVYDAKFDFSTIQNLTGKEDIVIGNDMTEPQFKEALEKLGLTIKEPVANPVQTYQSDIPDLLTKYHDPIGAQLPQRFHFDHITPTGHPDSWNLLDPSGKTIASGIHFNPDGSVTDTKALEEQLTPLGLKLDTSNTLTINHPGAIVGPDGLPTAPQTAELEPMTIQGKDLGEGGIWDYYLNKTGNVTETNGMKNLFRLYLHNNPNEAEGITQMRDAYFGKEIDLTKIPDTAQFHLPPSVFGQDGIEQFHTWNNEALERMNALVAEGAHDIKGPMHAIKFMETSGSEQDKLYATVLRLGYVGQDDKLPTPADINLLMERMGATATTPTTPIPETTLPPVEPVVLHPIRIYQEAIREPGQIFAKEITVPLVETVTTIAKEAGAKEIPWFPVFIPYREVLEAAGGEVVSAPKSKKALLSPFGMEEGYLDESALKERKSPRLAENPEAKLNQQEEIAWYLAGLSPEEAQTLEALASQENPPMNPEIRAVVTIPVGIGAGNVYQRLSSYVGQTNADGTPLDPKKIEFIVCDAKIAPPEGSVKADLPAETQAKAEVDRFLTEHPDIKVLYLTHTYEEPVAAGRIKRDLTSFALSRIGTLPTDAPEVAIVSDNAMGGLLAPTYLSSAIDALDAAPALDMVSGASQLPKQAYTEFPMLFAQHRAFELMDALVRHGDTRGVPGVYSGNLGIRASTLAAVGGYNPNALITEERELAWMVTSARGNPDSIATLPTLTATIDPKETVYAHLQQLGLAEVSVPLHSNEVYKDMTWQDMAKKATENYTTEQLETHLTAMYANMYPTLKTTNPARFDAYFKRSLDALGVTYEVQDGKVVITDDANLAANVSALVDVEAFAKDAAPVIVEATPRPSETPREVLEQVAGPAPEQAPTETPTEQIASSLSSPDVNQVSPLSDLESQPQKSETLPEGVEDRINYVVGQSKESATNVQFTTGELMDYLKSSVDIAGSRITSGAILIRGNMVKLAGMTAKTPMGEAHFEGELVSDPTHGLIVKQDTLKLKLPLLARLFEGPIKKSISDFNNLVLNHLNSRIDKAWQANRIDVVGDKLQVTFAKKAA